MVNNAQQSYCFSSELENTYFQDFSSQTFSILTSHLLLIIHSLIPHRKTTSPQVSLSVKSKSVHTSSRTFLVPSETPTLKESDQCLSLYYIVPIGISIQACSVFPYLSNNKESELLSIPPSPTQPSLHPQLPLLYH